MPQPSLTEQRAIAHFLDRETARLDALVTEKERWLELLAEKRRALITRAVTRGLNPAAPLRDSGLPWLGQIPAHWQAIRLKWTARLQGGFAFDSEDFLDEGIAVIRMNNLRRGFLDVSECKRISPQSAIPEFALEDGDLLLGMSGSIGDTGSLGNYARVRLDDLPAQMNQRVGRFRVEPKQLENGFLEAVLQSSGFAEQVLQFVTGTAQFNISSEQVGSIFTALPPLSEQRAIVAYISAETAKLDALRAATERTIGLLKERRAALIAAAVTGNIQILTTA